MHSVLKMMNFGLIITVWFMIFFMWTANGGWMTSVYSYQIGSLGFTVSSQWKNPDFILKNPDFILKNPDFTIEQQASALVPNTFSPVSRIVAGMIAVKCAHTNLIYQSRGMYTNLTF